MMTGGKGSHVLILLTICPLKCYGDTRPTLYKDASPTMVQNLPWIHAHNHGKKANCKKQSQWRITFRDSSMRIFQHF